MKYILVFVSLVLVCGSIQAIELGGKWNSSFRFDDRSGRDERFQYRLRLLPQLTLDTDKKFSINAFAVTGDEFSSSHNTLDDDEDDHFYLRRLYLRHQRENGKTEIGVLPTYKGRVSSTGLSKEGWIAGIRHVTNFDKGVFEVVLGDFDDVRASHALDLPRSLNYVELEYSSKVNNDFSYEIGFDRLLEGNFARTEVRYSASAQTTYAGEIIARLENGESKLVVSSTSGFTLLNYAIDFYGYYSYVHQGFGPKAELTEDFLATGHGISLEFEGKFNRESALEWFAKFEGYQDNSRVQIGLSYGMGF